MPNLIIRVPENNESPDLSNKVEHLSPSDSTMDEQSKHRGGGGLWKQLPQSSVSKYRQWITSKLETE